MHELTYNDVQNAANRIANICLKTPVKQNDQLDLLTGAKIFLKCENLQKSGSFKMRGATNAINSMAPSALRLGVVAHSSGNHASALATAATARGINSFLIIPKDAPTTKLKATERAGANITLCERSPQSRIDTMKRIQSATGSTEIHPFENPYVVAGQGTAALELLNAVDNLDYILAPVGGGGLLAGTITAASMPGAKTKIIGVEPTKTSIAKQSVETKKKFSHTKPASIADALLTGSLGNLTFPIICNSVDQILTVSESEILDAVRLIKDNMNIMVEPSSATCLAAVLSYKTLFLGKKVGIILSGGNISHDEYESIAIKLSTHMI